MQKLPSLRAVNVLLLLVLVLELANAFLMWLPQYVRLILNEALFVFLPAYLYLRFSKQLVRERIRWNWPGWKVIGLSLVIGAGLYPLSAASAGVIQSLLGYTNFPTPADAIPTTVLMSVLAVIAYAIMAPLCEEFLFRGVIQPVYEQHYRKWAVVIVGILFIMFHLSLLQGLSIILLSLALGYVNYRTRSLQASIAAHIAANFIASMVITAGVFKTSIDTWIFSLPALLIGPAAALAALAALNRLAPKRSANGEAAEAGEVQPIKQPGWLAVNWPIIGVVVLFLISAGGEFYISRTPALADPLVIEKTAWNTEQTWQYEIVNVIDEVVGSGKCLFTPDTLAEITCSSEVIAYKAEYNDSRGQGTFMSEGGTRTDNLKWQANSGQMESGSSVLNIKDGEYTSESTWSLEAESIRAAWAAKGEGDLDLSLPLSDTPLADNSELIFTPDYTWPWQLAGMIFLDEETAQVVRYSPYHWRNGTQDSGPVTESIQIVVVGQEEVGTPAGTFTAWKVTYGNAQTVWFDIESKAVVKFDNGMETWLLK